MLPLRKILCPTDFSDYSCESLAKAGELASHFGAELCVLHVMQPLVAPSYPSIAYVRKVPELEAAAREGAELELIKLLARFSFPNATVRPLARMGHPAHEIVKAAEEEKVDLIVIPTHGFTGWRQYVFGSVAESVLRLAPCPVLLRRIQGEAHEGLPIPPRKILCSTDFSEPSLEALQIAGEWASHFTAELGLVHVVAPLESPGLALLRERIEDSMRADAAQQLERILRERLPDPTAARPIVKIGSPADQIATTIAEEEASLLIIATSGADCLRSAVAGTPIERILFGSVVTNVLRLTSCPILTVRLPQEPEVR